MAGGDSAKLFEPINVESYALFSLQFFVRSQAGGTNGVITLLVSNDGYTFKPVSTHTVTLDTVGTNTYYIFVGSGDGVSAVTHVSASLKVNAITGGIIDKVIFMGNLGNS